MDAIFLCADAVAAWHSSWLDVFDVGWTRDDFVWIALERPPLIYLAGITLSPETTAEQIGEAPGAVYDCWDRVDLEPFGFERSRAETWFVRPPHPFSDDADPPELEIVQAGTSEAEEFEAVSARGFGGEAASPIPVGSVHPPNPDPRMTLWLARVDGEAVAAAMSYRTDRAVGIFGVATIEPVRRRGYGSALTRRAALVETGLPAVLNTDNDAAAGVYERLGFRPAGSFPLWTRTS